MDLLCIASDVITQHFIEMISFVVQTMQCNMGTNMPKHWPYWGNCGAVLNLTRPTVLEYWKKWVPQTMHCTFKSGRKLAYALALCCIVCVCSVDKWEEQPWQQRPQPRCNNYVHCMCIHSHDATIMGKFSRHDGTAKLVTTTPPYARPAHALACPCLFEFRFIIEFKFKFKSRFKN